jgi:carbon monoxide dehydrogenase subunit G
MEMKGEQLIVASQADTWAALNDPEILKGCIPGCESIERVTDSEYAVRMTARVGPVAAKFKGKLTLSDLKPPQSYSIAFEGQGGVAGFGKGGAHVQLAPEGDATRLSYQVKASVGGKLAQIGSRLVDAAARKLADDFFTAFNEKVASLHRAPAHADHEEHADDHPEPVPRDPDLPDVPPSSLAFFAAGTLVVSLVALIALF